MALERYAGRKVGVLGMGRSGHYFAYQHYGVLPDIVTMAKGIGNGCPLAAVVTRPEIAKALTSRIHFNTFGGNPVAMAAAQVVRRFAALGGQAVLRPGVLTDNGHPILDVRGLHIGDPLAMETEVNQWPGVVTVGIFARHRAQVCLLGTPQGVRQLTF